MPVMVAYSDEWMSHWTKSTANHTIMRKTFIFLMFMVVILPSLGLTSAQVKLTFCLHVESCLHIPLYFLQAFFEWATRANGTYRWECVFLPDNGAFFVNYVITSSFIGTALELMRFAELFMYACKLSCAMWGQFKSCKENCMISSFVFFIQVKSGSSRCATQFALGVQLRGSVCLDIAECFVGDNVQRVLSFDHTFRWDSFTFVYFLILHHFFFFQV